MKIIRISRSQYRVLVSDVLPYERPLFFTNRFFARFLKYYGVECRDGMLVATKKYEEGLDDMLAIIGGMPSDKRKAFQYNISKDGHEEGRQLTVIHPYHQVRMVEFYERYKTVLVDFCNRSHFSLRYPYKVATIQKREKGYLHYLSDDTKKFHTEETIKHYFAYKHYHNINDFYDDYRFLRAEKNFSRMYKSDIEHCFDSIKPAMLSMAMFDEEMIHCKGSMAEVFYMLNKRYLSSEKGIVIGPEFSRLYAEIILQRIDRDTEEIMKDKYGYTHYKDYAFYRYVDDGFLFCNSEDDMKVFYAVYDACLEKYGLKRKDKDKKDEDVKDSAKKHAYEHRPFLENITAGKLVLEEYIDHYLESRLDTFIGFKKIQKGVYDVPTALDYKMFVRAIRSVMGTYELEYKDVMSFMLGCMQKRLGVLLRRFNDLYKQYSQAEANSIINEQGREMKIRYEKDFSLFLDNLMDVLFYLYQCDSRMSTSIKTVAIISQMQRFVRGRFKFEDGLWSVKFHPLVVQALDEKITGLTRDLIHNMADDPKILMEHLNLLELQKCMAPATRLHPSVLVEKFVTNEVWTFFTIFELIHFIRKDIRYQPLLDVLNKQIAERIERLSHKGVSDTEAVLTLIEALCCPWIPIDVKKEYLDKFKNVNKEAVLKFAQKQKDLFIRWRNYDVLEEVQHICNTEVY